MPMNNNQKVQSAAARLAKLPVVHSACTKLSVLYINTKHSHPNLRSVCEGLESRVAAIVTPVCVKLEPHMSIAIDVACKGLDWLETAFPVLHMPTEQIVATAKNKMHEIQDVVSIAANGTVDCVQHTVTWLMAGRQQGDNQADLPLLERAITVASVGLDSALIMSEVLMDRVLPPTEEDDEEEAHLLEGFEAATLRRRYPARLASLTVKLCRRTFHVVGSKMPSIQVMENLSRPSSLVQDLQTSCLTLVWGVQGLPQHVQHQLVSVFFFFSQMYNLNYPPSQHQDDKDRRCLHAAKTSPTHKDVVSAHPQTTPSSGQKRQPAKMSPFNNGCNVKGCVRR